MTSTRHAMGSPGVKIVFQCGRNAMVTPSCWWFFRITGIELFRHTGTFVPCCVLGWKHEDHKNIQPILVFMHIKGVRIIRQSTRRGEDSVQRWTWIQLIYFRASQTAVADWRFHPIQKPQRRPLQAAFSSLSLVATGFGHD